MDWLSKDKIDFFLSIYLLSPSSDRDYSSTATQPRSRQDLWSELLQALPSKSGKKKIF